MCDVIETDITEYKATWLFRQLRNFPACKIRYGNINGHGFLLATNEATFHTLKQKIDAAKIKATKSLYCTLIPDNFAETMKISNPKIPTLTEVVA